MGNMRPRKLPGRGAKRPQTMQAYVKGGLQVPGAAPGTVVVSGPDARGIRLARLIVYVRARSDDRRELKRWAKVNGCVLSEVVWEGLGEEAYDISGMPETLERLWDHPTVLRWHYCVSCAIGTTGQGSGEDNTFAKAKARKREAVKIVRRDDIGEIMVGERTLPPMTSGKAHKPSATDPAARIPTDNAQETERVLAVEGFVK